MADDSLARRIINTWALDAAAFADVLAVHDPSWQSEARELAGGWLVLSGAGLYVNVALGVGIEASLTDDDVDVIIGRSAAIGVPPSVEVTPSTHRGTIERLTARGFAPAGSHTQVLARDIDPPADDHTGDRDDIVIRSVRSADDLARWQEVSALGWGHTTSAARRAADTFAVAAHAIDGDGMVIAFDAVDGRPLGCASLTIRDRLATLGGMSTIPAERGRGVQAALIHHRLGIARAHDCDIATSRAVVGGASARNVERHGFAPQFVIQTWQAGG
jgi:GNAT superfamily N-acetyltransferase